MPSTLIRWFCDEVDIQDDTYTFTWDGADEIAELIDDIEEERLKFQWEDADENEYLEYKMYRSDVTNETVLEIYDWCDDDEVDEQRDLWESQINTLKQECGG
jgi:hypothetical protein